MGNEGMMIRIPSEVKDQLRERAFEERRSQNSIIIDALTEYLKAKVPA